MQTLRCLTVFKALSQGWGVQKLININMEQYLQHAKFHRNSCGTLLVTLYSNTHRHKQTDKVHNPLQ